MPSARHVDSSGHFVTRVDLSAAGPLRYRGSGLEQNFASVCTGSAEEAGLLHLFRWLQR